MPLAYLSGLQRDNRFGFLEKRLPLENLLYIVLRSVDPHEQEVIHKYNIKTITSENINKTQCVKILSKYSLFLFESS
jgi:hypothetical protein